MNADISLLLFIWAGFAAYNVHAELRLCSRLGDKFDRSVLTVIVIYTAICAVAIWRLA